ncbi:sushi, von Willebrand factor type A, EGF and pentraxin domain-containing protein 1-like [Liolophura sinensis]|uniref:sushi, von Willebrand factor type A, EGF and pentraxin domain-containing protein 1-like n=1 Tax=Liolophura sinensis TaxID=3198878 RepID=UPI0031594FD7
MISRSRRRDEGGSVLLIVKVLGLFLIPEVNTSIECTTTIDLVFVMDLSGSVQTHGYETMKAFIKEMISRYQIGSANTRVGLVVFNIEAYVEFYLDTYYQKEELISAMDNIRSFGRETYTDRGLYSARMNVLQESAGDRQDVPNVVLVLTDGKSKDPTKTAYQANLLHSSGAEVIALGIGSNADLDELNAIASDPDEENMYRVSDFDSMSSIIDELVMKTCGGPMCSELPHPSNGRRLGEDRRVGASVYFECDSGYTLQGSDKRTCGPNDVWDGVIASCPPSACPELPHPENGRRVGNSLQVSSTVSFECNLGYTLYGSEQRTCQPDEQWDGQTAYCQVSECPELPNPENGYRVGSARQVGDTVSFSCNLGYTLQGSQQRTCQINKVWDGETSYCYVSLCPQLPYPENGRRIGDNYQVNDTVSFECNVGYTLHGSQQRTCQPNKVWDGETSHCYESLCDQLPAPEHGHLEGDLHRHIGDKVSLECMEGYAVEGSWERVCQDNREWSGQPGRCVRIPPEESMPTIEPDLPRMYPLYL